MNKKVLIGLIIISLAVAVPVLGAKVEVFNIMYDSAMSMFHASQPLSVGNSTGNITMNTSGLTYEGDSRPVASLQEYAYDLTGNAATYNSITCAASGLSILDRMTRFRTFDDGGGGGQCETLLWNVLLPDDYDPGTNITLTFDWVATEVSGTESVSWQAGMRATSVTDNYVTTETYLARQDVLTPTVLWDRATNIVFEFDGTSLLPGDAIDFVLLRDADNAADNADGDAFISKLMMEYVQTTQGLPIQDSNLAGN